LQCLGTNRDNMDDCYADAHRDRIYEALESEIKEKAPTCGRACEFLIIAALALAVDLGREDATANVTEEKLAGDDGMSNANPGALPYVGSVNSESASSEISSGQTFSTDPTGSLSSPRHPQGMERADSNSCSHPYFRGISHRRAVEL
jgi:hypothetical protein